MEITSLKFAILAIASIFGFYLLNHKYRIGYLVLLSFGFISTYSFVLSFYVVLYGLINFLIGIKIKTSTHSKALFRIGILINLTQLILIRYSSFLIEPVLNYFNSAIPLTGLSKIIIPLGVSYYTLQGIGYLINIRMKWEEPEKKLLNFLLYVMFYPKFLSGPIERSNHFLPQLKSVVVFSESQVSEGLRLMLFGFFKKVVIANNLGIIVNRVHLGLNSFGGADLWIVTLIQPLFLYFDFSGYTDIALGIAKTYGLNLLPNFNKPFLAENMTNFWRRFHISLSSWFNDYVFKQVSFKYRNWGRFATVFAVIVSWTLFGIWHGSGWNFMFLGLIQAIAIIYEFFTKNIRVRLSSHIPGSLRILLSRVITFVYYGLSLTFFFSPNLESALKYLTKLVDFNSYQKTTSLNHLVIFALALSILILGLDFLKQSHEKQVKKIEKFFFTNKAIRIVTYFIMTLLIMTFIGRKLVFVYQVF